MGSQFPGQGLIAGEVKAEKKKKNTRHKEVKANLPSQFGLFGEDLCLNYLFFFKKTQGFILLASVPYMSLSDLLYLV